MRGDKVGMLFLFVSPLVPKYHTERTILELYLQMSKGLDKRLLLYTPKIWSFFLGFGWYAIVVFFYIGFGVASIVPLY